MLPPARLRTAALRWLAQREHSRHELRGKLLRLAAQPPRRAAPRSPAERGGGPHGPHGPQGLLGPPADPPLDQSLDLSVEASLDRYEDPPFPPDDGDSPCGDIPAGEAPDPAATADAVECTLSWLEQRGYLSDQRFIDSRVHSLSQRHGLRRIEFELSRHTLRLDAEQRAAVAAQELQRARQLWQLRFGAVAADRAELARQIRFFTGRGFSSAVIRQVVRGAEDDD